MSYKTIETYVDVEVSLDEWTTDELVKEMSSRGYVCVKDTALGDLFSDELNYLIDIIDKSGETWYNRRIRDKLMAARYE